MCALVVQDGWFAVTLVGHAQRPDTPLFLWRRASELPRLRWLARKHGYQGLNAVLVKRAVRDIFAGAAPR